MDSRAIIVVILVIITTALANTSWSPCDRSCGSGTRKRKQCFWGNVCSDVYQGCNNHPCPAWGRWQPCSKTCGGGTRYKIDKCPDNNFATCPKTYSDCSTQACSIQKCQSGWSHRYKDHSSCCKNANERCGVVAKKATDRRVIGGTRSKEGQWPWAAVIVKKSSNTTHCGGSLVHNEWIITAGHCIEGFSKQELYILLGTLKIKTPSKHHQRFDIHSMIEHPGYKYPVHDVGLMKLSRPAVYTDYVKPICLPNKEIVPQDKMCVVAGWGLTQWQSSIPSDDLMQVSIRVLPYDACLQGYKRIRAVEYPSMNENQHLCVGQLSGGKDACVGDSGGPLMCQRCTTCGWYLAGSTSFGATECGVAGVPGVFMKMEVYENWIANIVGISLTDHFSC